MAIPPLATGIFAMGIVGGFLLPFANVISEHWHTTGIGTVTTAND